MRDYMSDMSLLSLWTWLRLQKARAQSGLPGFVPDFTEFEAHPDGFAKQVTFNQSSRSFVLESAQVRTRRAIGWRWMND